MERVQYVGLDVHKKSIEVSVLNGRNAAPEIEKALPNQETRIKVFFESEENQSGVLPYCVNKEIYGEIVFRKEYNNKQRILELGLGW